MSGSHPIELGGVGRSFEGLGGVERPSRSSWRGWEALSEDWLETTVPPGGWESIPEGKEGSGGLPGAPAGVSRGREAFPEGRQGSRGLPAGPGKIGSPYRRARVSVGPAAGCEAFQDVREG